MWLADIPNSPLVVGLSNPLVVSQLALSLPKVSDGSNPLVVSQLALSLPKV